MHDPFPASDFDPWAETYDQDVLTYTRFPFDGYQRVLEMVVAQAEAAARMSVLDLGTGTANLAVLFAELGCELWCSDFSSAMLAKARAKLPEAHFVSHDLRHAWPASLDRRFDRIVSAYVFHHFDLGQKVSLCRELVTRRLNPGGRLLVADLSFLDRPGLEAFKRQVDDWEDEFYWLADESLPALEGAGLAAEYLQVSSCAGVYHLHTRPTLEVSSRTDG